MSTSKAGICLALILSACGAAPTAWAAQATEAEALAERMLGAIGGRERWAALTGTVNDSQQNRPDEPTVVRAVITMDFQHPRFRIDTMAPGLHLVRVVDGDRHWRLNREGRIEDVPEDLRAEDARWYAGHVYRTLHRIAARDAALELARGREGRLEVHEGGARIAWFALDARGEPYAFGAHADERGAICGPWEFVREGVRHPSWVSNPDGSWRAMVKALRLNPDLHESLFERPPAPGDESRPR